MWSLVCHHNSRLNDDVDAWVIYHVSDIEIRFWCVYGRSESFSSNYSASKPKARSATPLTAKLPTLQGFAIRCKSDEDGGRNRCMDDLPNDQISSRWALKTIQPLQIMGNPIQGRVLQPTLTFNQSTCRKRNPWSWLQLNRVASTSRDHLESQFWFKPNWFSKMQRKGDLRHIHSWFLDWWSRWFGCNTYFGDSQKDLCRRSVRKKWVVEATRLQIDHKSTLLSP